MSESLGEQRKGWSGPTRPCQRGGSVSEADAKSTSRVQNLATAADLAVSRAGGQGQKVCWRKRCCIIRRRAESMAPSAARATTPQTPGCIAAVGGCASHRLARGSRCAILFVFPPPRDEHIIIGIIFSFPLVVHLEARSSELFTRPMAAVP